MCTVPLSPHKVLASFTPRDHVMKPEIPGQLEFYPPRSRSGPHLRRLDGPGLPVLPSDLMTCGVSMRHPVTTQPEPEAESIPGHPETRIMQFATGRAVSTGLPSGSLYCPTGQVCHSLGLRQGPGI